MELEIEIWIEELVDGYQTIKQSPTNLGLSFGVVFPTYLNPNNSFLIILQISLVFRYTQALMTDYYGAFSTSTCKFLGQIQSTNVDTCYLTMKKSKKLSEQNAPPSQLREIWA